MKIVIASGIYPPALGGPAQYAKGVEDAWRAKGHEVLVRTFGFERKLPTGLRHLWYFFRMLPALSGADFCLALDTLSVAVPALCAARLLGFFGLFRGAFVIRTGGDFLWESYVDRTGDLVLLRDFYETRVLVREGIVNRTRTRLSSKEHFIFNLTRWTLRGADKVAFSTEWQRDMFLSAYGLDVSRTAIVENFYGPKEIGPSGSDALAAAPGAEEPRPASGGKKIFISGARTTKLKNEARLRDAFALAQKADPSIELDTSTCTHEQFVQKMRSAWAVVLVSLSDISPNMILEAIRCGTPFVLTRENGLMPRIADIGLFVDPESTDDIARGILAMAEPFQHALYQKKIGLFHFTHTWEQIVEELL